MADLDSVYDPKSYEVKWRNFWAKGNYFNAESGSTRPPYTILMPPPNITSFLHMGHGLNNTLQDILCRWKRMNGFNVCWLPGTDHAGIATQMMVERALEKEGTTRKQLGRPAFEKRLMEWKEKFGGIIVEQLKRMGFSCDWSREAYTMTPELSKAVRHTFVTLFNEGLIYRNERLVNWDCQLQTAISDDEVETQELNGSLWFFKYPVVGSPDEFLTIATTRPETMLGDTAVAVNPDDERYTHLIGKKVKLPLTDREIPIIADAYVDKEFGTGVVKITPAHDPNDFKIGKRHGLPFITILNPNGTITADCPARFAGKDRFEARKDIVKAMKELGLFDKDVAHRNAVPHSERSKTVIEPRLSLQWYLSMKPLAEPAIAAAKSGELSFYPDLWKKTYLHWLENIEDWCISRQLWWGHRIPVWQCQDCKKPTAGETDPTACAHCGSAKIAQDEDVLDTWFSSWLWPLSPFGWPDKTADLATFFPSNVLITAPEIIFLWVARMIMAGYKFQGKLAFKDVYFNATVCDKQGRKFSKTLGNGIDPLDMIELHGADAVRFTTVSLAPLGGRVRMAVEDFDAGSRFINKIWNATRFVMKYVEPGKPIAKLDPVKLNVPCKWILNELREVAIKMDKHLAVYRINDAVDALYHFIWGSLCDWSIEAAKDALAGPDGETKQQTLSTLLFVFEQSFRLAAPVLPFVTEELWHHLPRHPDCDHPESLVVAKFPKAENLRAFESEAREWALVQDLISGLRSVRSQAEVSPKDPLPVLVKCDKALVEVFKNAAPWIKRLASVSDLTVGESTPRAGKCLAAVGNGYEAFLPVTGVIDIEKERKRLESEVKRVSAVVTGITNKLANPSFADRAPPEVVDETRKQGENMQAQLKNLRLNLDALRD